MSPSACQARKEFYETLRYFQNRLEETGVEVRLNTRATAEALLAGGFDEIIPPRASCRAPRRFPESTIRR